MVYAQKRKDGAQFFLFCSPPYLYHDFHPLKIILITFLWYSYQVHLYTISRFSEILTWVVQGGFKVTPSPVHDKNKQWSGE